jgi:hypothetical protein
MMSEHDCAAIFKASGFVLAGTTCIYSLSQFHSRSNYDSTPQYSVLFHSILPSHHRHPVLISPSGYPFEILFDSASDSPPGVRCLEFRNFPKAIAVSAR